MAFTRTDHNEVRGPSGVISDTVVQTDITAAVVTIDIHQKARAALTANATYLAIATPTNVQNAAQVQRLTRECSALIRLLIGADLLVENTDT